MNVSIITVNRNNAEGLEKTIRSVIQQLNASIEFIVIDGNSDDNSVEIIKKYASKLTYWVSETDSGIYNAMNKGIKIATGDYCLFLNSGDYLAENSLHKVLGFLGTHDIVYGNLIFIGDNIEFEMRYPDRVTFNTFFSATIGHSGCSFIRKQLFTEYGLYNENYSIVSDWEFFIKSLIFGSATYLHVDEFISYFDVNGVSHFKTDEMHKEREKVINELIPNKIYEDYLLLNELIKEKLISNQKPTTLYTKVKKACKKSLYNVFGSSSII